MKRCSLCTRITDELAIPCLVQERIHEYEVHSLMKKYTYSGTLNFFPDDGSFRAQTLRRKRNLTYYGICYITSVFCWYVINKVECGSLTGKRLLGDLDGEVQLIFEYI